MIDKIGYTRPAQNLNRANSARRTAAAGGTQFAGVLQQAENIGASGDIEAASPVAAMAGIGGLLGIQEVSDDEVRRKRAQKHGRLTLDALEQLRDGLLSGSLPIHSLRALENLVKAERGATDDPRLNSILDDIELRAAVELAKLEMSGLLG